MDFPWWRKETIYIKQSRDILVENKKYLTVNGEKASSIVHTLLTLIDENHSKNNVGNASSADKKHSCSCRCGELRTEIEGTKLDLVIAEARINEIEEMISVIRLANEETIFEIRQEIKESLNRSAMRPNKAQDDEIDFKEAGVVVDDDCNDEQSYNSQIKAILELVSSLQREKMMLIRENDVEVKMPM